MEVIFSPVYASACLSVERGQDYIKSFHAIFTNCSETMDEPIKFWRDPTQYGFLLCKRHLANVDENK